MKRYITLIVLTLIFALAVPCYAISFSDVSSDAWYASYVNDLTGKGVINGYTDGTFKPDGTVTKAEFIKLIITASLEDMNYEFISTTLNHWAAPYVKVGENYGIFEEGKYNESNLNEAISRIEIVEILTKCDILIKEGAQTSSSKRFIDISEITPDQEDYLRHAVGMGVINGDPEGTFRPFDTLKRSECAKVVYTYINR